MEGLPFLHASIDSCEMLCIKKSEILFRRLMDGQWQQSSDHKEIKEFLKMLSVCHTVLPEGGEEPETCKYQVGLVFKLSLIVYLQINRDFCLRKDMSTHALSVQNCMNHLFKR